MLGNISTRKFIMNYTDRSFRIAASASLGRKSTVASDERGVCGVLSDQLNSKSGRYLMLLASLDVKFIIVDDDLHEDVSNFAADPYVAKPLSEQPHSNPIVLCVQEGILFHRWAPFCQTT